MEEAFKNFQLDVGNTRVMDAIVSILKRDDASQKYGEGNRNEVVEKLAKDVEDVLGNSATIIFRSSGPLHDALQELLDAFWDFVDDSSTS